MSEQFDVFLCHNSQDKPEVIEIAKQLQQQGLRPWLDEWELRPGLSWQELLEEEIEQIKSAAVFVGSSGIGPWQKREIRAFLSEFVNRDCPVIPVLLENAPQMPTLPIFLKAMTWVDFRRSESNPMERLIWGITGDKPDKLLFPQNFVSKSPNFSQSSKLPIVAQEKIVSPPGTVSSLSKPTLSLKSAEFDVVTVNIRGQEIKREPGQAQYFTEDLGDGITLDMVAIPGGKFLMGTKDYEIESLVRKFRWDGFRREQPQHEMEIQPFFIGQYPITQEQWRVIASLPKIKHDLKPAPSRFQGNKLPVEKVSWDDAVEFCRRLSSKTGKEYRLPSEAEWEYACRARTVTPFHFGETITDKLGNYDARTTYASEPTGQYRRKTTTVGSFLPNAFGLYDMHGNVWEWCADAWHDNYEGVRQDGNAWLSGESMMKVMRGGSWNNNPWYWRSASRDYYTSNACISYIGLRVVHVASKTQTFYPVK